MLPKLDGRALQLLREDKEWPDEAAGILPSSTTHQQMLTGPTKMLPTSVHAISQSISKLSVTTFMCLLVASCGGGDSNSSATRTPVSRLSSSDASPVLSSAFAPATVVANKAVFSGPRANYIIVQAASGYTVIDNVGTDGTTNLSLGVTRLQFTDVVVNVDIGSLAQGMKTEDLKLLIELYIAFFNRVPEAEGLAFWIERFKAGDDINKIADDFYSGAIAYPQLTGYSVSMELSEFVKIIYKNVLGRSGATAPPEADVAFWAGRINSGADTKGTLVKSMLNSAHTFLGDPTWGWTATLLDNKFTVGHYFSVQQGLNYLTPEVSIQKTMAIAAAVTPEGTEAAIALIPVTAGTAPVPPVPVPPVVNNLTASTGTTAYGVLGTANARVVFVSSSTGVVPVLLEGQVAAPATATAPVALTFSPDACAVDSNDFKAICIGYRSSRIAVLDLTKYANSFSSADITVQEIESGAGPAALSFSGGSCVICGVAADVGKKRFVIGGTGGFRVFNYGSTTADAVYDIPVGENFGFLARATSNSFVIAPEYSPKGGQRKLRVINVDTKKTYTWTKNTDSVADLGSDASSFQNSDVDAVAADIVTGMLAMSSESFADFLLVDFAQATFDEASMTFNAPHAIAKPAGTSQVPRLTDVAISTTLSILLSHGEGAATIGVTQLPKVPGVGGNFPAGTGALGVFDLNDPGLDKTACGITSFRGKGDPHGLGLYAGLDNGQKALIVDANNTCAAIFDLAQMAVAARDPADSNKIDTTQAGVRALIKFIKL